MAPLLAWAADALLVHDSWVELPLMAYQLPVLQMDGIDDSWVQLHLMAHHPPVL